MAITYTKNETFDGTRVQTMPDPDNEGETISETLIASFSFLFSSPTSFDAAFLLASVSKPSCST